MQNSVVENKSKAALLLKLLGKKISPEIIKHLSDSDKGKLRQLLTNLKDPSFSEEKDVLLEFISQISNSKTEKGFFESNQVLKVIQEIENALKSEEELDCIDLLKEKSKKEIHQLIQNENMKTVAKILCFANEEVSAEILKSFNTNQNEELFQCIENLDLYDDNERDQLRRFIKFKEDIIRKKENARFINGKGKIIGEILNKLNPNESNNIMGKIKKLSPKFADTIKKHYYGFEDLMNIERATFNQFFQTIHPIVIGYFVKGFGVEHKELFFTKLDSKLSKRVMLELNSLGPVTLAEIEEAQKGVLNHFKSFIEEGNSSMRLGAI